MSSKVNNGRRERVKFGNYEGLAGIVEHEGVTRLSFVGKVRDLGDPATGTVGDETYRVLAIKPSTLLNARNLSMIVLTIERIDVAAEGDANG